jgi:hypothetical protein
LVILVLLTGPAWAAAQEKLDLRLHLAKGDTHHMNVTLDQTIDQTAGPAHQQTSQTVGVTYTFKVEDVDVQGNATVSVRYDAVSFHARTPSGVVDYDPGKPAAGPMPVMVSALAALVGESYSVTVDPRGSVTQVGGLQKMLADVLAHLNVSDGVVRAAVEKTVRQQLAEGNLKQSLRDVFAPFPGRPIEIGQNWVRNSPLTLGFPMNLETTYTLQSRENGVATISVVGKAATVPNALLDLGPVKMNYDLKGEQTGSIEIIESSGWARAATVSQNLSGSATLRAPNTDPQTVPVTIRTDVKSEEK